MIGMTDEKLPKRPEEMNPLLLAYIGDAVYELYVRYHLLARGILRPDELQRSATAYVSAAAQAEAVRRTEEMLTEEERDILRRGRKRETRKHPPAGGAGRLPRQHGPGGLGRLLVSDGTVRAASSDDACDIAPDGRGRKRMNTEWIVGRRSVLEAMKAGRELEKLLVAEGAAKGGLADLIRQARQKGIPVQQVPRSRLDRLAEGANHQGVAAEAAAYKYARLEDLFRRAEEREEAPFFILLDGIEDPHNLGSILRTADAAGAHGVIIPKRRAAGLTPAVGKASAGAVEYVPVVRVTNLHRTAEELKESGLWIIGSAPEAASDFTEADYTLPLALVIGSEGRGMSRLMKETCDLLVRLPMAGRVASLNASVAAALLMYEVLRRRRGQGDR